MSLEKPSYVPSGRVVVTGFGGLCALGTGVEKFWPELLAGKSGVGKITRLDPTNFTTHIAAEMKDFNASDWMDPKEARRADTFLAFSLAASRMALEHSGLQLDEELKAETGVLIGSGIGGLTLMAEQSRILYERGPSKVSPFWVPYMIADMASGIVSIHFDLRGPNHSVVSACSTGANALGDAYHIVKRGDARVMLAGGAEAPVNEIALAAFCASRALSTNNDNASTACRPFDKNRDGFVMGEGGAVLVLEDRDHAIARGATIYAEVLGYGMSADAYHITAPHPEGRGAVSAMSKAIRQAGIEPEQIGYINAHATSTEIGDPMEVGAIKKVFGDHAYNLKVSSTKSMHGHTLGAAGALESLICILAMRDGIVPPTINYETPDERCDLNHVPNVAQEAKLDYVLNNSFGFGGHNVALVFGKGN